MRPILLPLLALLLAPAAALAQDPAARVTCDPVAGTLVIEYVLDATELPDAEQPDLVNLGALLVLDEEETSIVDTRTHTVECELGGDKFTVELEPGVTNANLMGRCGGAQTGLVSVLRDGKRLLDGLEFEAINCHERERWLRRVTVGADGTAPELEYAPYEQ